MLYLGALGDRYGRKMMLVLGTALAIPMSLLAAYAPSDEVLFVARVGGGLAAGMAYPTTLALITALWSGPGRTKSIALWSALGGAIAALGPLVAGALLEEFDWGSVFLITLPLAVVALVMAFRLRAEPRERDRRPGRQPRRDPVGRARRRADPRDQLRAGPERRSARARARARSRSRRSVRSTSGSDVPRTRCTTCMSRGAASSGLRRARGSSSSARSWPPCSSASSTSRTCSGYSTLEAGAAILPAALVMVVVAPRSAKLVEARGARFTLLFGYVFLLAAFLWMLFLWNEGAPYWQIAVAYIFIGAGVGLAGTPASHSLTGLGAGDARRNGLRHRRPPARPRRRDHAVDLRRAPHGRVRVGRVGRRSPRPTRASRDSTQAQLTKSFAGAEAVAQQHPQYADAIIAGAKEAFLEGDDWAYTAGVVAILLGAVLVYFMFPRHEEEERLLASYHAHDTGRATGATATAAPTSSA